MRRLLCFVCAVFAAASVVSLTSLSAKAQTGEQYGPSDGAEASSDLQETMAPDEEPSGASLSQEVSISQGSAADPNSSEVVAAREDLAEEERLPGYHQIVDNTTKGAFRATGWKEERGSLSYEGSFVVAEGRQAARFSVKIPTTNDYSVYAWWPRASKDGTAKYGVQTVSGTKWSEVQQRTNSSGMWVKIGSFAMEEGQRSVQVAAGAVDGGQVFADAVAVVRGEAAPPEDQAMIAAEARTTDSRGLERFSGRDVVRQARRHIGDNYRYATCTRSVKSCTCLTKMAVKPFNHKLPLTEGGQWKYDRSRKIDKSNLRPGDEVFFKEGRSRYITHVGIYAGNGRIVHASSYFGKVVEREMKYIDGYFGAKRFKSR